MIVMRELAQPLGLVQAVVVGVPHGPLVIHRVERQLCFGRRPVLLDLGPHRFGNRPRGGDAQGAGQRLFAAGRRRCCGWDIGMVTGAAIPRSCSGVEWEGRVLVTRQ
jgi:hypothetical protein